MGLREFMQRAIEGLEQTSRDLELFRRVTGSLAISIVVLAAVLVYVSHRFPRR